MVDVGIIGLGEAWDVRYRPALEQLGQRIRVRAFCDAVLGRAEQVAGELGTDSVEGFTALIRRPDVKAVLIFDCAWWGTVPVQIVTAAGKPAFLASELGDDLEALTSLHAEAVSAGVTLMPELPQRYTAATTRLQELLATRLGRALRLQACVREGTQIHDVIDWCRYVASASPASIEYRPASPNGSREITISFDPPRTGGQQTVAVLRVVTHDKDDRSADRYEVVGEKGRAVLRLPDRVSWSIGDDERVESLSAERSAEEVMLDHFCRRVVGGLIPVTDLGDICRSLAVARAAENSRQTGQPVVLKNRR